jgi:hypothetical protein
VLETLALLSFCLLVGLLSLAIVVWFIVTGGLLSLDNLLLTLISLTVGGIFMSIVAWSIHTGEFQDALNQLRKEQSQNHPSSEPPAA